MERLRDLLGIKEESQVLMQCAINIQDLASIQSSALVESNIVENILGATFSQTFSKESIFDVSGPG